MPTKTVKTKMMIAFKAGDVRSYVQVTWKSKKGTVGYKITGDKSGDVSVSGPSDQTSIPVYRKECSIFNKTEGDIECTWETP